MLALPFLALSFVVVFVFLDSLLEHEDVEDDFETEEDDDGRMFAKALLLSLLSVSHSSHVSKSS